MSQKKYDRKDRWRSKVVGFSVSPEKIRVTVLSGKFVASAICFADIPAFFLSSLRLSSHIFMSFRDVIFVFDG